MFQAFRCTYSHILCECLYHDRDRLLVFWTLLMFSVSMVTIFDLSNKTAQSRGIYYYFHAVAREGIL